MVSTGAVAAYVCLRMGLAEPLRHNNAPRSKEHNGRGALGLFSQACTAKHHQTGTGQVYQRGLPQEFQRSCHTDTLADRSTQGCRCRIPFPNAARTPYPDSPSRPTQVARPLRVDERMLNPHGVCAEPSCGCPRRLAGLGECTGVVGLRRTHRIATCNKLTDRGAQSAGRYVDRPGSTGHGQFTRRTNRGRRRCAECRIPLRTQRS